MTLILVGTCGVNAPAPQLVPFRHITAEDEHTLIIVTYSKHVKILLQLPKTYSIKHLACTIHACTDMKYGLQIAHYKADKMAAEYIHKTYEGMRFYITSHRSDITVDVNHYEPMIFMLPMVNGLRRKSTGIVGVVGGSMTFTQLEWNIHFDTHYRPKIRVMAVRDHYASGPQKKKYRICMRVHIPADRTIDRDTKLFFTEHWRWLLHGRRVDCWIKLQAAIIRTLLTNPPPCLVGCDFIVYRPMAKYLWASNGDISDIFAHMIANAFSQRIADMIVSNGSGVSHDVVDKTNDDYPDDEGTGDIYCNV